MAERKGAVPSRWREIDRRFAPGSPARMRETAALADLERFSRTRNLPPPVFLSLNIVSPTDSDAQSRQVAEWHAQAAAQAEAVGFTVAKGPKGWPDPLPADAGYINPLNGAHPRHFQEAWGRALARGVQDALGPRLEGGGAP